MSEDEARRLRDEIEELRRERDRLRDDVATVRGGSPAWRRTATGVLVVLSLVALAASLPGTWTRRTVLDTDRYVELISEVAEQPAVQARLAARVTDASFQALDVEGRLSSSLADVQTELAFLAGPITRAVHDLVRERVEELLASERFQELWAGLNRVAHRQILAVLRGDSESVGIVDGTVVLNTWPLVNEVLAGLSDLASELAGRPVVLPEVSAETLPAEAVERIEVALGVELPTELGTIEIYDADEIAAVQRAVFLFDRGVVFLVVVWAAMFAAAIATSTRRRRTLVQLLVASAIVVVLERRFAILTVDSVLERLAPGARAAGRATADVLLGGLLMYSGWLLAIFVAGAIVVAITGPYAWATGARTAIAEVGGAAVGMVRGTEAGPVARWVAARRDPLMIAGAATFILVILVWGVGMVGFLSLAAILGLYEVAVWRTAEGLAPEATGR